MVDQSGRLVYTGADVTKGQQLFLHNGLMEYGSAFGHGAYLGPDYTADYLHREARLSNAASGALSADAVTQRTINALRTNRYDEETAACSDSAPQQAAAFRALVPLLQPILLRPAHASTDCGRTRSQTRSNFANS